VQFTQAIAPEDVGDGWGTSTPAAEGMDGDALSRAMVNVEAGQYPHVDGVVVVRNDRTIALSLQEHHLGDRDATVAGPVR
jgi:hypothetical protein